jgi:hypothetical protein
MDRAGKIAFLRRLLTDPAYRRLLETDPAQVLGPRYTPEDLHMLNTALEKARLANADIGRIADELLCANGGPCGIAR